MNKISLFVLTVIIHSCSPDKQKIANTIERIPVEVHNVSPEASSFIEKIEIVPLETNDSSLLYKYKKVMYDKEMDLYAIYDRDQNITTFSGNGTYIGNSKKMNGEGPQQYHMAIDMKFNPYLKGIDLLNPYGTIYTYSPTFELISKRKITAEFPLDYLMPLSSDNYIFTYPFLWTDQEVSFANMKTQQINNTSYSETISSGNGMDRECFHKVGEQFYFVPMGINYYFYQIDAKEMKLIPIMYLDFGDSEIKEDALPGRSTGERVSSNDEKSEIIKEVQERSQFLRESNKIIPMVKFFNDNYVYIYFVKSTKGVGGNFIFNRKTKKGFLVRDEKPFIMNVCFGIVDNILLSICVPDLLPKVIDRRLMSPEEIDKMERLKEDDNPVILKYYLKK